MSSYFAKKVVAYLAFDFERLKTIGFSSIMYVNLNVILGMLNLYD